MNANACTLVSFTTLATPSLPSRVLMALRERGFVFQVDIEEDLAHRDRRVETALMALFRDTHMEEAFDALYARTRGALQSWISHLLSGRSQSGDPTEMVQDTFINVYRYAGSFKDCKGNSFRGWVRTIAANVVRRARMRSRAWSLQALPEGIQEPIDSRATPDRAASNCEQRQCLRQAYTLLLLHYADAYQRLSERDREALHMIEVRGLSYTEAGNLLQVGRSNMKMIMFRSRKRIRAHMQRAMAGEMSGLSAAG